MEFIPYSPFILLTVFLISLIIAGAVSAKKISGRPLLENMMSGYVTCGINNEGKPTYRYKTGIR